MFGFAGLALVASLASITWLGAPTDAFAQAPERAAIVPPIAVDIRMIHAGTEQGRVDKECEPLKEKLPPKFKTMRVMQKKQLVLQLGHPGAVAVSATRVLKVVPVAIIEGRVHMFLQLPGVFNTRVRMANNQPLILGPQPSPDGGYLIVELRPRFSEPRRGNVQFQKANSFRQE